MTGPVAKIFYEFNDLRLDVQQRLLTAAGNGQPIPLPPKAFETLLYFVERRGELLEKTAIMKAVWPNIIVEENSLNQNISIIRRALGETPGQHRFIVTEPGRGYRFVAEVNAVAEQPAPSTRAPQPLPPQVPQVPAAQRGSIAVLAFANLTGDPAKEYFSDGMAEELIHTLARIPGLKVPSRTSSFSYKGHNTDVRQIARDLDVAAVLEGSVRSAGERIRVTAQLIDAQSGFHLWSQHYDREFGDLFKLQDELAHSIVASLRAALGGHDADQSLPQPPTKDLEAYNLYLQAMSVQATHSPFDGLQRAMRLLERAVDRDPLFARAHAAIASVRAVAIVLDVPLPGTLADSEREVLRGLALDPSLGTANATLGIIYAAQGKWISARDRFQDAFASDANDPSARQAYGMHLLGSVGSLRQYAETSIEAHRLAPAWLPAILNLAVAHMVLDETPAAHKYVELAAELGVVRTGPLMSDLFAQIAVRQGRYDEAAEIMVNALAPDITAEGGGDTVRQVFRALGNRVAAEAPVAALDSLRARATNAGMTQFMKRRFMLWYTYLGAIHRSFEVANESLDYFAQSGTIGSAWSFLWLREMLPFRQDPRFQAMCRRMRMFEYWSKHGAPDKCELNGLTLICPNYS
jgi:TolB-like protein